MHSKIDDLHLPIAGLPRGWIVLGSALACWVAVFAVWQGLSSLFLYFFA